MLETVMYINETAVKSPGSDGVKVTDEPIWSQNTGRSVDKDAKMVGDIVAWKRTIDITWDRLTYEEMRKIRTAIMAVEKKNPFYTIRYPDPAQNGNPNVLVSTKVYNANIPRKLSTLVNGAYHDVTISWVEQ